ncbi:MAG: hypothetical protein WBG43_07115 [Marinifilaceae bacterium]
MEKKEAMTEDAVKRIKKTVQTKPESKTVKTDFEKRAVKAVKKVKDN